MPRAPDWRVDSSPRKLTRRQYGLVVGGGVLLTGLQVLLIPRALGAHGFGVAVIGISVTQAVFMLADLGFSRLADDSTRVTEERNRWRSWAMTATNATVAVFVLGCAALAAVGAHRQVAVVCALGAVTAYVLVPLKLAAGAAEARGDEVTAARFHFVWQNIPKVGLVVGAVVSRDPTWTVFGGLASAAVFGRPRIGRLDLSDGVRRTGRTLAPAWFSVLAAFLMAYGGTYSIGVVRGLAAAGRYDFDFRVFLATTYLYYPFASMLTARINRGESDAPRTVTVRAGVVVACAAAAAVVVLPIAQRAVVGFDALSVPTLVVLAALALAAMVSYMMAATLIAYGRLWPTVTASIAAGVVVAVGQTTITPAFGAIGAASVSLAAGLLAALVQTRAVLRLSRERR